MCITESSTYNKSISNTGRCVVGLITVISSLITSLKMLYFLSEFYSHFDKPVKCFPFNM